MTIWSALARALAAAALFIACASVRAGEITVYTALEEDDVRVYLAEFAKAKPDIKVNLLRLSTGDLVARILAEKANPRHDVIWGTALTQVNDPRILEMAEAQIIGGDGEPGTIGLADALGHFAARAQIVMSAAENARARVVAVADFHHVRRVLGQHHDAAHAGV